MDELQKRGIKRFLWSCPEGSIIHVYRCIESSTYNASPACWTLLIYIQSIVQVMIRLAKIVIATKLSFLWSTQTWECRTTECWQWIAALWQIQSIGVLSTQGEGQSAQPFQCATPLSLLFSHHYLTKHLSIKGCCIFCGPHYIITSIAVQTFLHSALDVYNCVGIGRANKGEQTSTITGYGVWYVCEESM